MRLMPHPVAPAAVAAPLAQIEVQVLMFGMICQTTGENKTTLRLPRDATVSDALAALGVIYGAQFLHLVMRTAAAKASHTQVSLNGQLVRDMSARVAVSADSATIELILLSGHEGG